MLKMRSMRLRLPWKKMRHPGQHHYPYKHNELLSQTHRFNMQTQPQMQVLLRQLQGASQEARQTNHPAS